MSLRMLHPWPRAALDWTPKVLGHDDARLTRGWPLIELTPGRTTVRALPDDFYLWELMDLEIGSQERLLEFVRSWGPCSPALLDAPPPWQPETLVESEDSGATHWSSAAAVYSWNREHDYVRNDATIYIAELRLSLATLRDLTRVCLLDSGVLSFRRVVTAWECGPVPPPDSSTAAEWAAAKLSLGLCESRPHVSASRRRRQAAEDDALVLDVLSACCLELFNDLATDVHYRQCQRCSRVFLNQRGRSSSGRHSGGDVRYCSTRCASAATSENHRRRQKLSGALVRTAPTGPGDDSESVGGTTRFLLEQDSHLDSHS